MEGLQVELKAAKTKWAKEIELSKAEKGEEGYPFPVCCTRYIPKPESASNWDVEELPVRLVFHSAELADKHVSIEVGEMPGELPAAIEKAVEAEWKKMLGKKKKETDWEIDKIFTWIETKFVTLIGLCPEYVDTYEGCNDEGASCRRYTLVAPAGEEAEEEAEGEEGELDEEEQEKRMAEYMERERARLEAEFEEKFKNDEVKKKQALDGIFEDGEKAKVLSKKENAALNLSRKEKSGQRWRKTGSKSNKPDPDAKGKDGKKK